MCIHMQNCITFYSEMASIHFHVKPERPTTSSVTLQKLKKEIAAYPTLQIHIPLPAQREIILLIMLQLKTQKSS